MPRYRKLPVDIDANEWVGGPVEASILIDWALPLGGTIRYVSGSVKDDGLGHEVWCPEHLEIETLEGTMTAQKGDFIIRGVQGEFYPCKPDIFWKTYEEI